PGQANYAAANTFLDALAHHRTNTTAVSWGHWHTDTQLTGHLTKADRNRLAALGIHPMPTSTGLRHLDAALTGTEPHLCPMRFSPAGLTRDTTPPVLHRLLPAGAKHTGTRTAKGVLPQQLAALPADRHHDHVQHLVTTTTATVLGHADSANIHPTTNFRDLGFDSLTAVQLRNHLTHASGLPLPPTLVFDHPTPLALTEHLLTRLRPQQPPSQVDALLDQLTSLTETVTDADRAHLADRLRAVQQLLEDGSEPELSADRIESASASELFDLIDNELGIR
ncbi:beta-ketoacyl reductase, partial [Actinophytocola gossypii]